MKYFNTNLFFFLSLMLISFGKSLKIEQKSSGKILKVTIVNLEDGILTIKNSRGASFKVALDTLTEVSVKKVKEALKSKEEESQKNDELSDKDVTRYRMINKVIGHKLFSEKVSLWDEKSAEIAGRLNWKLESIKKNSSSYRLYTEKSYQFLGAHPYCVTLYGGKEDSPEQFSLIYANKGDFGSKFGMGPDHFKKINPNEKPPTTLEEAIEIDAKLIASKLTEALGDPETQYYGEKEDKRKVKRWNIANHAFLLSALDEEYVFLTIVSKENADAKGKIKFIKDSELKKMHLTNVKKEENGDVFIDNIPMVNQGPKGYCAPATFERAMRYMQVPADMYLLATAATSEKGTNTIKLAEDCKRIVRSKARRIKNLNLDKDFKIKILKKYINKGVPVLWQMRSLEKYNNLVNERTRARKNVTNMTDWAKSIQVEADTVKDSLTSQENFHICMVIGYNEETQEVAVSDSWGPAYEIRWVHVDIAKAVTSRGGFVIDF